LAVTGVAFTTAFALNVPAVRAMGVAASNGWHTLRPATAAAASNVDRRKDLRIFSPWELAKLLTAGTGDATQHTFDRFSGYAVQLGIQT
jgi:hypothetical protein